MTAEFDPDAPMITVGQGWFAPTMKGDFIRVRDYAPLQRAIGWSSGVPMTPGDMERWMVEAAERLDAVPETLELRLAREPNEDDVVLILQGWRHASAQEIAKRDAYLADLRAKEAEDERRHHERRHAQYLELKAEFEGAG